MSRSPESEKDVEGDGLTQGNATTVEQMAKKVVRLALAHEYSRKPLRRADINLKGAFWES